jgi:hypothetical protein
LFANEWRGVAIFGFGWIAAALLLVRSHRPRIEGAHVVMAFALIVSLFYTFYVPALWFFRRYLAPAELAIALAWSAAFGALWKSGRSASRAVAIGILALACAASIFQCVRWSRMDPAALDVGLEGSKGYREPAILLFPRLPAGAVVGAFQSGALTYYAPASIRIVNLDGVVDRAAHRAVVDGRLRDYAHDRGVAWLADWPLNKGALDFFSRHAVTAAPAFHEIWRGPLRGPDQTILWTLEWPRP